MTAAARSHGNTRLVVDRVMARFFLCSACAMGNSATPRGVSSGELQNPQEPAESAERRGKVAWLATSRLARLGPIALLAAPLLIGVTLFLTVFATYRSVATASDLLVRGQADLIHDSVRGELVRQRATQPDTFDLGAVMDALSGEG